MCKINIIKMSILSPSVIPLLLRYLIVVDVCKLRGHGDGHGDVPRGRRVSGVQTLACLCKQNCHQYSHEAVCISGIVRKF